MSEEPRKRQRLEDGDKSPPSDSQIDCLKSRLEDKQAEIISLRKENQNLLNETSHLSANISKFTSTWAKHITDFQSLCQAYTMDNSYQFQPGSAFEALSKSEDPIPELAALTKSCLRPLLIAIEKFKSGYTNEEINKKIFALQDTYIKASSQFSEYKSEIQQLKQSNSRLSSLISSRNSELDEMRQQKENVNIKLIKATEALKCKCRCRCGARKTEVDDDYDDIKEIKAELNKIKEEKRFYMIQAEEKVEKLSKMQMELEVSEERLVRSRAFRSLVSQARSIVKSIETLKKTNEELQRINDNFNEDKYKEIKGIIAKEEDKRSEIENQTKILQARIVNIEKERDEALLNLNMMKKEKIHQKTSSNYKEIIEDLEEERNRLKKQLAEYQKEKVELAQRLEDEQKKINDLKDQLVLKEIELSKAAAKDEPMHDIPETEVARRLKEYKNEVMELKNQIKLKEAAISKGDSAIRQLKQDMKAEKRYSESLTNEIDVTGNAYEETMRKNKVLAAQLIEIEQNCIQLMNEKIKEKNWKALMENQQHLLEEQAKAKEQVILQYQEVITEEKKLSLSRMEIINLLETKFKVLEQKCANMNSTQSENNRKYEELMNCKKELQEKLREAERICIKHATECIQYKFLYEYNEKCWKENEEKIAAFRESMYLKTNDELFMAEITKYRELIRCSQCKTRNKDCLLTKCLHLFCRRCIELNLSQKKRKCPCCLTKFTLEEVRTFYWS